ncbi:MAG: M20/M25/M40 family metallo-hydrolase [Clostridia bacterium]|nr:M20/M25/M40 family metallo-hydrolase [Clostridia bacterium]
MQTDIKNWIENHFDEQFELLKTLAAIPAPSGSEDARVAFLVELLDKYGYECRVDEAKNVIVPFFDGTPCGITCYCAHTDVVFPDTEPLPVQIDGDRIYAPGVGDNTANIVALLMMLRFIRENGLRPKNPVIFVFNSCEEGLGNLKGIRQIMQAHSGRIKEVVSFDCNLGDGLFTTAVGSERWSVTASTVGGHSFSAFGNPSAIHHMSKFVTALYAQKLPPFAGRTTYNAGVISGGTSVNTIAQRCEMLYEYRSDSAEALSYMHESFKALLCEANCEEARFDAELIGERPCGGDVDEDAFAALVDRCGEAIKAVTGEYPKTVMGSTDANIPLSLGVPALAFGLLNGGGAHTREEWLDIPSLKTGLEVAFRLVIGAHFE